MDPKNLLKCIQETMDLGRAIEHIACEDIIQDEILDARYPQEKHDKMGDELFSIGFRFREDLRKFNEKQKIILNELQKMKLHFAKEMKES